MSILSKHIGSNNWKPAHILPDDEDNVLVTWQDRDGDYQGPYRAYFNSDNSRFFPIDSLCNCPLDIDFWIEMPEFPE
jgi:hypothetical protein